jgi:short subunit dehydrogenase-like uncharacterized protein
LVENKSEKGIVITDGVGFHGIMSDFIAEAAKQFDKVIIYSGYQLVLFNKVNRKG